MKYWSYLVSIVRSRRSVNLFVLAIFSILLFVSTNDVVRPSHPALTTLASQIIETCKSAKYKPSCYDKEIPKIMELGVSMEDTFLVTKYVQDADRDYWYCHVLGHNVSAKEVSYNHTPWNKVIARCPFGQCSNGCLHGAFQERFRGETVSQEELNSLMPEFDAICKKKGSARHLTGLEQASCYHAIGHLTMYVTNGRMTPSLKLCDAIAKNEEGDFTQLCYDGAFMQVFQPLEPEDEALVKDFAPQSPSESASYCAEFSGTQRESCHTESWPKYVKEFRNKPRSIEKFCGKGSDEATSRCYAAVIYVMSPQLDLDVDRIASYCNELTFAKGRCFAHSASRMIETDHRLAPRAAQLCKRTTGESQTKCFEELVFYSSYNYFLGTPELEELCAALPEEYQQECYNPSGKITKNPYFSDTQVSGNE